MNWNTVWNNCLDTVARDSVLELVELLGQGRHLSGTLLSVGEIAIAEVVGGLAVADPYYVPSNSVSDLIRSINSKLALSTA